MRVWISRPYAASLVSYSSHPTPGNAWVIPDGQPFTVRTSLLKRALTFGGIPAILILLPSALSSHFAMGGATGFIALIGLVLVGVQVYIGRSMGPLLAVGPSGRWVKTGPRRSSRALWLPWDEIEQVYRRPIGLQTVLCVKAKVPQEGLTVANLSAFTGPNAGVARGYLGAGFMVAFLLTDHSLPDVVQAIGQFSAGRVQVG
jgi:hypothetical protein